MVYFIAPGIAFLIGVAWLVWEYRQTSPQERPQDREQFAQGSLGECW